MTRLCFRNSDEKLEWMQVLAKAVHDLAQKKSSLKVQRESEECDVKVLTVLNSRHLNASFPFTPPSSKCPL